MDLKEKSHDNPQNHDYHNHNHNDENEAGAAPDT